MLQLDELKRKITNFFYTTSGKYFPMSNTNNYY